MATAPSFQDLVDQGEVEITTARPDLTLNDGDVVEADLHAAAAMSDAVIRYASLTFRETFIDGAEGEALTTLVNDHLNVQRKEASAARVTMAFTRTSGGSGGTIDASSVVGTAFDSTGKQIRYTTDADYIVAAAANGPFDIPCTAEVVGVEGNADAATITHVITTLFDSTFTVTNAARAAGGNDEETDEELRQRAKAFYSTLRRGTAAALEYGALQVASVRVATVSENTTTGIVTVLVGDGDGNSTVEMIEEVETELENWRAAGVVVTVTGASQSTVDAVITLTSVRAGFDITEAAPIIVDSVIARGKKQHPGQTLTLDTIIAAVIAPFSDDIFGMTIVLTVDGTPQTTPADVVPASTKTIRFGTVAVS